MLVWREISSKRHWAIKQTVLWPFLTSLSRDCPPSPLQIYPELVSCKEFG